MTEATGGARPVAVVGAGLTGASWAGLFAAHGLEVRVHDSDRARAEAALDRARAAVAFLVENRLADAEAAERGRGALRTVADPRHAYEEVQLVQECVTEDLAVKRAVFAEADGLAPADALIATSSSGLSITDIQEGLAGSGRCLAAHPYNPPHLVPLVELAPGPSTSPETMERARAFYESVGKEPVVLRRDVPGYIANRLSAALWREAVELVRGGVATVAEVDSAVRNGPGLRWSVMGPHMIYHLGGGPDGIRGHVAHLAHVKEGMLRDLATWTTFPLDTVDVLESGVLQEAAGRSIDDLAAIRDRALVAALRARVGIERSSVTPRVARGSQGRPVAAVPGVDRTTLAVGERSLLVRFDLSAGAGIPLHAHPHEQTGFLVSGDLTLLADGSSWSVEPGDAWSIPGGVRHGARTRGGATITEVFAPLREDYLPGPEETPPDSGA